MRDIKFRVLATDKDWKYFSLGDLACGDAITHEGLQYNPDTWCQYTGLKDINGKEIYEGDIFKRVCKYVRIQKETYENFKNCKEFEFTFIVKFRWNLGFFLSRQPCKLSTRLGKNINNEDSFVKTPRNMRSLEVIGNIHENPELLEG